MGGEKGWTEQGLVGHSKHLGFYSQGNGEAKEGLSKRRPDQICPLRTARCNAENVPWG